jgi:redox-sensitive bicupin YhaK (pirin superfamily)
MQYLWHPHSGIATVTVAFEGDVRIADTTGSNVVLPAGGVEWMRAGHGVWHTGQVESKRLVGFQLWVALPPNLENGASAAHYAMPKDLPMVGPARVVLGTFRGATSPIDAPPMTYLAVTLAAGERFTYQPAKDETVGWAAVADGALDTVSSTIEQGELAVFEESLAPMDFVAREKTRFVIGSAVPHPHELALGNYSVHTSDEALARGEAEIKRIGRELRANGTLRR